MAAELSARVRAADGTAARAVELPDDVFNVQANIPLMHQVVVAQLAAARQGTHKTKTRGQVSGGGRKPYKQKGTGRARQGRVHVVESFVDGETPSTKAALAALAAVTDSAKVLVVLSPEDELNWLSLRNLPTVHLLEAGQLNTYDVLVADEVVFTADALDEFLGVPAVSTPIDTDEVEDSAEAGADDETDEDAEDEAAEEESE